MRKRYAISTLAAVLFLIFGMVSAHAQTTVTVGTGTSEQTYPIDTYWMNCADESIYTNSDLTGGGWSAAAGYYISNVRWYIGTSSSYYGGTLKIYLENTSATSLSSSTWSPTGTLVWSGNLPSLGTTGWLNFTLPSSFYYSGGNLLVRAVREDNTYYYPYATFRYSTTGTYLHRAAAQDGSMPTTLYTSYNRPNIQFVFQTTGPPAITVTSQPTGCATTANQTVVATLFSPVGISASAIWYKKNSGSWTYSTPTSIVGSTYTYTINHANVGGVTAGDQISWYIGAADANGTPIVATYPAGGSGNSPAPGSTPPTTVMKYTVPGSLPYTENFDLGQGAWTFGGSQVGDWRVGVPGGAIGPTALSTPNALLCQKTPSYVYSDGAQSWAQFPPLNFVGLVQDPVLVLNHKYNTEGSYDGGRVEYSINGGSTWTTLGTVASPNGVNWYDAASVYSSNGQPVWVGTYTTSWKRSVHTLTGLAGQACVLLRFYFSSDGSVYYAGWAIDDVAVGNFPQKDIEVVSANVSYATNRWAQVINENHPVSAVIRTNGWETPPTTVTLTYKVGSMPASAADGVSQTFTPTWAGGQFTANFTTPFTPTALGPVVVYVKAFYTGDMATGNDSKSYTMNVQTNKVYGFEDFEGLPTTGLPTNFRVGWSVVNGGGASTWGVFLGGFNPNPASLVAGYIQDANPDDYLISPPALLQAGSSYRVRFKYAGCQWGSGPSTVKLLYGKTPVPAQMTLLNTWTVPNTGLLIDALGPIAGVAPYFNTDPSGASNYYIAFQASGPAASSGCIALDDVILDENPTPPPKIGYGLPGTPNGQHVDNPAIPLQVLAIYKKPGKIVKTYEVVSTTYNYGAPGDFLWDVVSNTSWIKVTKSIANPTLFAIPNPFTPARPRQLQTFNLEVDPTNLLPGTYNGQIVLYGSLYNSQYPAGIKATNEPYTVTVQLTVMDAGSGVPGAAGSLRACQTNLSVRPQPYLFLDPKTNLPFAAVTVTSGTIPSMCIEAFPGLLPAGIARYRYVDRYFNVTAGGTGWTADIDWYYTDTEAAMGGVTAPAKLRNIRQLVSGGSWQDPTSGITSTSFPNMYYVKGTGYNPNNIAGNHCLAHNWVPKQGADMPVAFALGQNYPNPFNPTTKIDFSVAEESHVKLTVYNSLGDEVAVLVNETMQAGAYSVPFDASALPSGSYMYRLTAGSFSDTKRMLLAK